MQGPQVDSSCVFQGPASRRHAYAQRLSTTSPPLPVMVARRDPGRLPYALRPRWRHAGGAALVAPRSDADGEGDRRPAAGHVRAGRRLGGPRRRGAPAHRQGPTAVQRRGAPTPRRHPGGPDRTPAGPRHHRPLHPLRALRVRLRVQPRLALPHVRPRLHPPPPRPRDGRC